jgi:hypothetical protein
MQHSQENTPGSFMIDYRGKKRACWFNSGLAWQDSIDISIGSTSQRQINVNVDKQKKPWSTSSFDVGSGLHTGRKHVWAPRRQGIFRKCISRLVIVALSASPPGVNELCVCIYDSWTSNTFLQSYFLASSLVLTASILLTLLPTTQSEFYLL